MARFDQFDAVAPGTLGAVERDVSDRGLIAPDDPISTFKFSFDQSEDLGGDGGRRRGGGRSGSGRGSSRQGTGRG